MFEDDKKPLEGRHRAATPHSLVLPAGFKHLPNRTHRNITGKRSLVRKPSNITVIMEGFVTEETVVTIFRGPMCNIYLQHTQDKYSEIEIYCYGIKPRERGGTIRLPLRLLSHCLCIQPLHTMHNLCKCSAMDRRKQILYIFYLYLSSQGTHRAWLPL